MVIEESVNLYFRDSGRIRRIDSCGTITAVAGRGGPSGSSETDGSAISAQLGFGFALALGRDCALCFSEVDLNRIRKLTPDGQLILVAGAPQPTGVYPYLSDGDGGPAVSAHLNQPRPIAADRAGNIYVVEANRKIRRITPDGNITTIAGDGVNRSESGPGDGGPDTTAGFTFILSLAIDTQALLDISHCVIAHSPAACR